VKTIGDFSRLTEEKALSFQAENSDIMLRNAVIRALPGFPTALEKINKKFGH